MPLLLPDRVIREIRGERARTLALAQRNEVCEAFTAEMRRIDAHLELVYWPDHVEPPLGFIAGRYHVVRHNPDASGSVEPFVDELGGFREPDSSIFEWLAKSDMWSERTMAERRHVAKRAEDIAAAARRRADEDRREELRDRVNAATRTQISTHKPQSGWTQVAGAPKAKV